MGKEKLKIIFFTFFIEFRIKINYKKKKKKLLLEL
jgi:hypothetical protein